MFERFEFIGFRQDGTSVYAASHEIWNTVDVVLPEGYWNGGQVPSHVHIALDMEDVCPCCTVRLDERGWCMNERCWSITALHGEQFGYRRNGDYPFIQAAMAQRQAAWEAAQQAQGWVPDPKTYGALADALVGGRV